MLIGESAGGLLLPVPLVLHGSSGVADDELSRAVGHGIVKINVGTILNVAFTSIVRSRLAGDERIVDPRTYLSPARDEIAAVVARTVGALQQPLASGDMASGRADGGSTSLRSGAV